MNATTDFRLPAEVNAELDRLVDEVERQPGRPLVWDDAEASIPDVSKLEDALPQGVTLDDAVGMLKLAMLTECATETYANVFRESAAQYDAPWLGRFIDRVWVPDELSHYAPYRAMLLSLGYSEHELDAEIADVRARAYEHCCGRTPTELTTYGVVQEYLTDHWHGLTARLLEGVAERAAQVARAIKRRETLHTVWYRRMTAVQAGLLPEALPLIASTLHRFRLPGSSLVPEYQTHAMAWMRSMGVDFTGLTRGLTRNLSEVLGSAERIGQVLAAVAGKKGRLGKAGIVARLPWPSGVKAAGHTLLGEALLDRLGLPYPGAGAKGGPQGVADSLRRFVRAFLARRIDLGVFHTEAEPPSPIIHDPSL